MTKFLYLSVIIKKTWLSKNSFPYEILGIALKQNTTAFVPKYKILFTKSHELRKLVVVLNLLTLSIVSKFNRRY
jgi:hypothetical protein